MLRYWEDLPEAEVAAILGCSAGTVKSTASRGLARLREATGATRVAELGSMMTDTFEADLRRALARRAAQHP